MKFKLLINFILTLSLIGCACSKNEIEDGTYTFKYIEYYENNEKKTIDCTDVESLDIKKQTTCQSKDLTITIKDNYYTLSMTQGHLITGYFKLHKDQIHVSQNEDGEYKYTGWMHYRNNKIYYGINEVYVVLDN